MTRSELARELRLKDSYVGNHWQRIKKLQEKMGVYIYKQGRGENAKYGIRYEGEPHVRWDFQDR